jgi:transmembrane sensor
MDQALDWLIRLEHCDPQQRDEFDAWLAADPAHAEAFAQAQALWNSAPLVQVATRLDRQPRPAKRRSLRRLWKPMACAAALLLTVFNFTNLPLRLEADHLTQVGERQRLQLQDGSTVLLNTDSAFSSHQDEQRRTARLYQGEAFFNVPDSRNHPLEIEAGPLHMSASSTDFAVRYLDGEARIQVQRGAVDVRTSPGNTRISLSAGNSLRVGPSGVSQPEPMGYNDLAWVQGRLIFDNRPLSQVLAELRRYYPGWIINTNHALDTVAVTGNYRLDNPLDVMRSLAQITSASLHELPKMVILN